MRHDWMFRGEAMSRVRGMKRPWAWRARTGVRMTCSDIERRGVIIDGRLHQIGRPEDPEDEKGVTDPPSAGVSPVVRWQCDRLQHKTSLRRCHRPDSTQGLRRQFVDPREADRADGRM